jgi:hypothetical protein
MGLAALAIIAAGMVAVMLGLLRIRVPLATIRRLDQTEANLERYDAWRGKRTEIEADGPTGADEMKAYMRQRAIIWGALIVAGIVLVVVGLTLA